MAPAGTQAHGYTVRQVSGDKAYLCPGCNGQITAGLVHVVVFEDEEPDLRRHWHTPCWRQEVRRLR
jgi:hypothetical protein